MERRNATRDFNRAAHHHGSNNKRYLKRSAHHRERAAIRAALAHHDWDTLHAPVITQSATAWDIT